MLSALAAGLLLGFSAGLSPGPMLALVLAQTLRHGSREGCKVALTPLVTDAPIILVALTLATRLAERHFWLGLISIAGALFVFYLAWESFWPAPGDAQAPVDSPRSWLKGSITNLLNPHPWIFWLTVGAASLAQALAQGWLVVAAFLFGFYLLLVGAKVMVALLAGRSRQWLAGRNYRLTMRVLAVMLALFAVLLLQEGLKRMALI